MAIAAIASRTTQEADVARGVPLFRDYEEAIATSGAELAYVSVANSEHARWARRCLEEGMHVIVDKPACLRLSEARELVDLAGSRGRCLAEATVFSYHPQFRVLLEGLDGTATERRRVDAIFSFPPLDREDFRYRADLGGGAINDLGPYVAATSRALFTSAPSRVHCEVLARHASGVEIAFAVLMTYPSGGALSGHFGFDTAYNNRLLAFGPGASAELPRAYTMPADEPAGVLLRRPRGEERLEIAPADMFRNFLVEVLDAIESADSGPFFQALLADAAVVEALRGAAAMA
jgi:dTDP-3,4-didehydro-2,6-dideoxy-alpha-D-glucose 3-reductase